MPVVTDNAKNVLDSETFHNMKILQNWK